MSRGCADLSHFTCYQVVIIAAIEREYPSRLIFPGASFYLSNLSTGRSVWVCQKNKRVKETVEVSESEEVMGISALFLMSNESLQTALTR